LIIFIQPLVSPISLDIEPQILVAGKINNATLYVKNVGKDDIENLQIAISIIGDDPSPLLRGGVSMQGSRVLAPWRGFNGLTPLCVTK